jgi:hypothetical protein
MSEKILTLLCIPPQKHPIYLVYSRDKYKYEHQDSIEDINKHMEFFIEDHSCPSDIVRSDYVIVENDTDPHGLIKHIKTIRCPDDYDEGNSSMGQLNELFKEIDHN